MKEGKPSFSAEIMAFYRAAESAKPEAERLYHDPLAGAFLRTPLRLLAGNRILAGIVTWFFTERWIPGGISVVLARSRYVDDCLEACLAEGIGQLVIVGAGYDSRAYRFSALREGVKVFEVDHPATQKVKTMRLMKSLGSVPGHVVYLPVNLMRATLQKALAESGYDRTLKTLFICEGLSYYLPARAVDGILAFVAGNSERGSSIVFDYFVHMSADQARESGVSRQRLELMTRSARRSGEPVLFRLSPESVPEFLSMRGYQIRASLTASDLKRLYFQGKNRRRPVSPHLGVVHATVT